MEVNSIDEAFLDLTHLASQNIENELCKIQKFIYQNLGLPISIGLAPNKTLAKIAGLFAKKSQGIFNYLALESKQKQQLLERVLVADIWGVGKQNQKKLNSLGIYTALELQKFDSSIIQKNLGITGSRLQYELRGLACLEIKPNPKPKKQIISSASFAQKIEKLTLLEQALASHIEIASQKLRAQNSVAGSISIFIQTSPWNRSPYYFKSEQAVFSTAHDSAAHFIKVAKAMLKTIYQENLAYQKTGVSLNQIIPKQAQSSLFQTECNSQSSHLIDQINKQHGAKTLRYGACGLNTSTWQPQKTHASPNYNSSWQELLLVKN